MPPKTNLTIIGFDLGHAETALADVKDPLSSDLGKVELPCALAKQFVTVTAVCEYPGGVRIGYPAVNERHSTALYVAFKSPDLDQVSVSRPIGLFVARMREELIDAGKMSPADAVRWVFGAPSGWDDGVVAQYATLLRQAGLADVEVVAESRAAMLYARDSGEIKVDSAKLTGSVLVVDLGSSTTDFTGVVGLKIRPTDTGTQLGAGLIDKTIMNWLLDEHPSRAELQRWIEENPIEKSRLELACRAAKEDYFRNLAASGGNDDVTGGEIYRPVSTGGKYFPIDLTRADMDRILATPIPALYDETWEDAFRSDLTEAALSLEPSPDLVLLTGGASRMLFVREIARELFGSDRVATGAEPELAIARGLALAGRIGVRAAGFRDDMRKLLSSDQVSSLVEGRIDDLATALGDTVADDFIDRYATPNFRYWQRGGLTTLADFEREVISDAKNEISDPDNVDIRRAIATWQNDLHPDLAQLTRPICDRWGIPRSAMELPSVTLESRDWNLDLNVTDVLAKQVGVIAGWVAGIVVGAFITALLAAGVFTGPLFLLIGGVAIASAASGASDKAKEKIREANIPLKIRQRFKPESVFKNSGEKERELARDIARRISSDSAGAITNQVSRRLEFELKELAAEAELLIS